MLERDPDHGLGKHDDQIHPWRDPMKTTKRVHMFLTAVAATAVLAGAGVASVAALDSDAAEPRREAPVLRGDASDAGPNAWDANNCDVLVAALGENASPVC
jgi:hypothetical protein